MFVSHFLTFRILQTMIHGLMSVSGAKPSKIISTYLLLKYFSFLISTTALPDSRFTLNLASSVDSGIQCQKPNCLTAKALHFNS